jgi:hypothetical protein
MNKLKQTSVNSQSRHLKNLSKRFLKRALTRTGLKEKSLSVQCKSASALKAKVFMSHKKNFLVSVQFYCSLH